jgi:hypothetical protein
VTDCAHPIAENLNTLAKGEKDKAYFYFLGLIISEPGRYRIRITLIRISHSSETSPEGEVRFDVYLDSHSILVVEEASNPSRLSK